MPGVPKEAPGYSSSVPARAVIVVLERAVRAPQAFDPALARLTPVALVAYRRWLARFTPPCRQQPSCSEHAVRRVRQYGWRRGLQLTLARMEACR